MKALLTIVAMILVLAILVFAAFNFATPQKVKDSVMTAYGYTYDDNWYYGKYETTGFLGIKVRNCYGRVRNDGEEFSFAGFNPFNMTVYHN